jgi:hypothetical protein
MVKKRVANGASGPQGRRGVLITLEAVLVTTAASLRGRADATTTNHHVAMWRAESKMGAHDILR